MTTETTTPNPLDPLDPVAQLREDARRYTEHADAARERLAHHERLAERARRDVEVNTDASFKYIAAADALESVTGTVGR